MTQAADRAVRRKKATSVQKVAITGLVLLSALVVIGYVSAGDAISIGIWGGILVYHADQVVRERHRFGRKVVLRTQVNGYLLVMLNPLFLLQNLLLAVGSLTRSIGQALRLHRTPAEFRCQLPFEGEWLVLAGGMDRRDSHSWYILGQRYAYDFMRPPPQEERDNEAMSTLEDYAAFGSPILSPADGTVIAAVDGISDSKFVGPRSGWIWPWFRDLRGNHVVIEHAAGGRKVYSLLAHLRKGSVAVRRGEQVRAGELVGQCGNSGHSTEPHLHFHVQDGPVVYWGAGVPIRFVSNNGETDEGVLLRRGERVTGVETHQR